MTDKVNIALLLGDPSGIGPELISKLLPNKELDEANILVIGERNILEDAKKFVSMQKDKAFSYGTTHTGGIDDVSAIAFTKKGGLKTPKIVAYKGVAPIKTNLIKGDIDVGVLNLGEALTEINEKKLCVAVVLANNRMAKLSKVPTAKELGIDVSLSTVRGFVLLFLFFVF